jgi:hypothetical protein
MESGPYLSPSVADHPLRPTKDLRLGQLFSNQLPNPTRAYLITTYIHFHCLSLFIMWYYYFIQYITYSINSHINYHIHLYDITYSKLLGKFSRLTHPYAMQIVQYHSHSTRMC